MRKFLSTISVTSVAATGVHNAALDKVVQMIQDMKSQAEKDKQTEEV